MCLPFRFVEAHPHSENAADSKQAQLTGAGARRLKLRAVERGLVSVEMVLLGEDCKRLGDLISQYSLTTHPAAKL